ncbi:hypothetical protein SAY87_019474 [Trapa incisa]|uniref:Uncharacterized protein n=1 Tax=Trapa incisa TaxID=236973 RepID=A0AAN7JZB2_9MYRT|nr:hypothetical protein SAY87_019474 [Trapa incisa]
MEVYLPYIIDMNFSDLSSQTNDKLMKILSNSQQVLLAFIDSKKKANPMCPGMIITVYNNGRSCAVEEHSAAAAQSAYYLS